jgi:hypothetical protein
MPAPEKSRGRGGNYEKSRLFPSFHF